MDRFDDLLIKARAEMLGKSQPRQVITKDTAFSMAWDLTKGFEDQMRAMQARQQRPGFMQRVKDSFGANRKTPQQSVSETLQGMGGQGLGQRQQMNSIPLPTQQSNTTTTDPNFFDFMGQQGGLKPPTPSRTSRASGSPPGFVDFMGQHDFDDEAPQALEPSQVPMQADIDTERPVTESTEQVSGSPPSSAWWSQGGQYRVPGENPAVRASIARKRGSPPTDQEKFNALNILNPQRQSPAEIMAEMGKRREESQRNKKPKEQVRPLSMADVPKEKPQEEQVSERTKGNIGDRKGSGEGWSEYQNAMKLREQYANAFQRRVDAGEMTEDEAVELWMDIQERTPEVRLPKLPKEKQMGFDEANQKLFGNATLNPSPKREAVEPIREKTTTQEYKRPINEAHLPVPTQKPRNTALSTRGEEKIEPLDKITMQDGSVRQLGSGPIRNPLQLGQGRSPPQLTEGGEQRTSQAKAGRKLERPSPNIIDGFKPPEPKQKKTPKKEPKPQVKEQTESVNQPKPQVEEQSKPVPPTTKQKTLFGGDEKSAPVKNNNVTATTEEAKKRSEQRNKIRGNTEATTKVGGEKGGSNEQEKPLPRISSMTDSSVLNELMDRAEEGDEAARKHLYNSMGDLQDHHPSVAERYENAFGKMIQDANLSLLPSGMRNSLLKDNNADVNYSLLPNGWV